MNVCKLKRKKQAFEIAKINSCCFRTFPVAILEPFGRTPSWRVACSNAKLFNFERYILLNNWSTGYHTGLRLSGFDYLLLLYNISISWYLCKRDLQIRPITPFGGRVFVVKCDESQYNHKSKVIRQQNVIFVFNCTRLSWKVCKNFCQIHKESVICWETWHEKCMRYF